MIFGKKLKKSTPEEEQKFSQDLKKENINSKDVFAILFSSFFVIFLPCVIILVILASFVLWLFGVL